MNSRNSVRFHQTSVWWGERHTFSALLTATDFFLTQILLPFCFQSISFHNGPSLILCFRVLWVWVNNGCGLKFSGCFHIMSPQKGPQNSSFNFYIFQQNKIVKEHFVVISGFTHKYGSLNLIHIVAELGKQRIGSCLACVYRVMDARRKFGEHERSVRVARGDSREQF